MGTDRTEAGLVLIGCSKGIKMRNRCSGRLVGIK